jgi:hypothetical protein
MQQAVQVLVPTLRGHDAEVGVAEGVQPDRISLTVREQGEDRRDHPCILNFVSPCSAWAIDSLASSTTRTVTLVSVSASRRKYRSERANSFQSMRRTSSPG